MAGDHADEVADMQPSDQEPPATTNAGVVKPGLLDLPQELYDIIFQEYFKDVYLVYLNDGQRASLKRVRDGPSQALAILRTCKQLYRRAKPLLQAHATVTVRAARRELARDPLLRGSPFWDYTRRFRRLHAHGIGAHPVSLSLDLQSFLYWNEAYLLRDLLYLWPQTEELTVGSVTIPSDMLPALILNSPAPAVPQELVFAKLVTACRASWLTFHGTIVYALRQHGLGQNVTFLIRWRIQARTWCEWEEEVVDRDIAHGTLNPETGRVEYHEAMGFPAQQLPPSAMAALVDHSLQPDMALTRPLPSDQRAWSFSQVWAGVRASGA